jgi:hypothetical protein
VDGKRGVEYMIPRPYHPQPDALLHMDDPPHCPPYHHRHPFPGGGTICRWFQEVGPFRTWDAAHQLLDELFDEASRRTGIARSDLDGLQGAGGAHAREPMHRALEADAKLQEAARNWLLQRSGERVLAIGDFPPHILHQMLAVGGQVAQCHHLDHHGNLPPHFRHLAPYGLKPVSIHDVEFSSYSLVVFRGFVEGNSVWCDETASSLLSRPIATPVQLLAGDHVPAHLTVCVADAPYVRIPIFD